MGTWPDRQGKGHRLWNQIEQGSILALAAREPGDGGRVASSL